MPAVCFLPKCRNSESLQRMLVRSGNAAMTAYLLIAVLEAPYALAPGPTAYAAAEDTFKMTPGLPSNAFKYARLRMYGTFTFKS